MFSLSSRRYTGAKTKLLDSIDESILKSFDYRERKNLSFFDVFSGTGVVSEHFAKKKEFNHIIINDFYTQISSFIKAFLHKILLT
ncbi:DNA adenine methylase [Campylobacter vulpis]|uniref:DNA adenine methylase n=1 Tax=Campylobacter vulpis TaxID=1655500 RepID=UPI00207AEFFB|nr:DNA adenine methylase [Campylobacter vulpis]